MGRFQKKFAMSDPHLNVDMMQVKVDKDGRMTLVRKKPPKHDKALPWKKKWDWE